MEQDFIIRTHREGTVNTTASIEDTLNNMGGTGLRNRFLGSVVAIVERADGRNTKQKLRWGEDNDPKFNESLQRDADVLLAEVTRAVEGGGDKGELRVKFVAKL